MFQSAEVKRIRKRRMSFVARTLFVLALFPLAQGLSYFLELPQWDFESFEERVQNSSKVTIAHFERSCGKTKRSGERTAAAVSAAVREASLVYGIDEQLLYSVMFVESRCRQSARSPRGAVGLMQVLPSTAQSLGYANAANVRQNIFAGAKYLSLLSAEFDDDLRLTLAAYNAGPGAVRRYDDVPPYRETQRYVEKVLAVYSALQVRVVEEEVRI